MYEPFPDHVDLTIESSPLDLGLVQGFSTAVKDVQGTVEAHVRVTGSAVRGRAPFSMRPSTPAGLVWPPPVHTIVATEPLAEGFAVELSVQVSP